MKRKVVCAVVAIFCLALPVFGQKKQQGKVIIKLASMVPENSEWGHMVNKMAAEWSRVTNGEVQLQVFANGTQGSEEEVLRKLNMNTVQAAILTSFGLTKIAPEILTISCPFLVRNDDEFKEVFRSVKDDFEAKINAKNYYTLTLVNCGWVKIFSRTPIYVPADLKRQKIGSAPTEPEMSRTFRSMGYQVVEVDNTRVLIALNGGTIDAIYMSPIYVAGAQLFGVAKSMASLNLAPILGGVVMNKYAWESIPARHKESLLNVSRRVGLELEASLKKLEADTIRQMKNNGLKENEVSPQQLQEWYDDVNKAVPNLLGGTFDQATYNKIDSLLRTYRSRQ